MAINVPWRRHTLIPCFIAGGAPEASTTTSAPIPPVRPSITFGRLSFSTLIMVSTPNECATFSRTAWSLFVPQSTIWLAPIFLAINAEIRPIGPGPRMTTKSPISIRPSPLNRIASPRTSRSPAPSSPACARAERPKSSSAR